MTDVAKHTAPTMRAKLSEPKDEPVKKITLPVSEAAARTVNAIPDRTMRKILDARDIGSGRARIRTAIIEATLKMLEEG